MSLPALVIALHLLIPHAQGQGGMASGDKARSYYQQGENAFRHERYDTALKDFEMALSMARFGYGEESLQADAMHFAAVSACRLGNGKAAIRHASDYVAWATGKNLATDLARSRNDLTAAYLALADVEQARAALKLAATAVERAKRPAETERYKELEAQVDAAATPAPSP